MEKLDHDILQWIAQQTGDESLADQIARLTVKKRDYMKTGFFVYFDLPENVANIPEGLRPVCPHIDCAELPDGAGCDLFFRNGRLHYLEIYARGGFFPEELDSYRLRVSS